ITIKGFKSFPDRTRLEFGEGVSVIVGPNGSGKSNVTDAVLWAMGEQSPLAVRGSSMQDVIFGGGRGVQPRSAAEVEIVLDNSDGTVDVPLSEISIVRRLDRNGEGGYRLNGARCRLTDVIEALSDTGLGKETHSVVSQGRVESIVTSKPRDRRLLIEEAAGLGKHRKRRRRAQLKLEHTQENLDRALDIEREARSRLRPLKRQAEAAELHERLQRQILQVRWELAREEVRVCRAQLGQAEELAAQARTARTEVDGKLAETVTRRGAAERALAERAERHDALSGLLYGARSARERLNLRAEQVASNAQTLARRIERVEQDLEQLAPASAHAGGSQEDPAVAATSLSEDRIAALETQLAELHATREQEIEREIAELQAERERRRGLLAQAESEVGEACTARERADAHAEQLREALVALERAAQEARRESARVGAELAAANQFLRAHARVGGEHADAPKALSDELRVQDGYELALAAALGGRLDASLVEDVAGAEALLNRAGPDGGAALLAENAAAGRPVGSPAPTGERAIPAPGARRLLELLSGPQAVLELAGRLLGDAWVVERLEDLPGDFAGIAVTKQGRVWFAAWGEVRQLSEGGSERVLARRNERDRLVASAEQAAQAEHQARSACELALQELGEADEARVLAERGLRAAERAQAEAAEAQRRTEWLIEQRRAAPAQGAQAVRQAELEGELAAERRQRERREQDRRERQMRIERLRRQHETDLASQPRAERLAAALTLAAEAVQQRVEQFEGELAADRVAGEQMAGELRACAAQEAEIQSALRACGEAVTEAEVAAQRLRDRAGEAELESAGVAEQLGLDEAERDGAHEPLEEEQALALRTRMERLSRRREQLGPVNPLAQEEYAQALAHVEELESQRGDLETALRELRSVIRDTDRQIQETFEETFAAAARNFEELAGEVFPGGSGRLRLVHDEYPEGHRQAQRPVLGGQPLPQGEAPDEDAIEAAAEAESEAERGGEEQQLPGVEIEITPAGKSSKRLTLLSGGEKSMTALAFLFAVFLARPCPFYILDEVEAALDDLNLGRFLTLLRRYADRAQFIVITHQKRTMEAADWLYGVSMGQNGVSKVLSRRLPPEAAQPPEPTEIAQVA
ncbi:MAG TPA: AAA family ATPase, partial [Solirubrobacteraceae bacterium]|nr:AAA family ATPase [Solirubrobacteraceae bacterium]